MPVAARQRGRDWHERSLAAGGVRPSLRRCSCCFQSSGCEADYQAPPLHARLLVIERICPARLRECIDDEREARADLNMLAGFGGRECILQEYEALLDRTGFSVIATSRTAFELTPNVARHRAQSWAPLWSAVRRSHWSRNQTDG